MEKVYLVIRASHNKKVYRDIAIRGEHTLSQLAEAIIDAFDFDFDHAYGFYNNLKHHYDSDEAYELFVDMGDPVNENAKSVERTKIQDVYTLNRKMMFLFDYGDDWMFETECLRLEPVRPRARLPITINSVGKAPEQYPVYDEEDVA